MLIGVLTFIPMELHATNDAEALNKALEAGLKQSGIEDGFNNFSQRTQYIVGQMIDQSTPFSSKSVFFLSATSWSIFVDQKIVANFANPVFSKVQNTLSLKKDVASLDFRLSF